MSQTTPLRPAYEELPSLAFTSSPVVESPYPSQATNYSGRFYKFPQASLPKPHRLTDALPSSPPELKQAPAVKLAPAPALSESVSPTKSKPSPLGKRERIEFVEEYSIMGSDYGFCVDTTGHVHVSPLKKQARPEQPAITREQILNQESDSEPDEPENNLEYNAIGDFARIITRSKIETADPSAKQERASFFDQTTPRSQGQTLAIPSTPLSTGSFQANIMTPPGAMFAFDNLMYSTGMTPYLPRNQN